MRTRSLAENARDRDKRAEVLAAWATSLQKSRRRLQAGAVAAAEEYKAISAAQPLLAAKADRAPACGIALQDGR